jgi:ATP-dependent RNA helicase DeaD
MPPAILRLAENYLNDPKQFLLSADDLSGEGIEQAFLVIKDRDKLKHLINFIEGNEKGQTIVFCSTKYRTRDVARNLSRTNFSVVAIEGDMSQHRREKSMSQFRRGKADILVATDVAARGIDVPEVALVVNYDVPNQELLYFHRIGRTARAGAKGKAITLVSYSSIGDWRIIKQQTKVEMTDLNEEMGIKINIPDPLKRETGQRRMGYQRSSYGNRGRHSGSRHGSARDQYDRRNKKSGSRGEGGKRYYGLKSRW